MSVFPIAEPRPAAAGRALGGVLALVTLGVGLTTAIDSTSASVPLILVAGLGLIGMLLLAVARYDLAIAIGFLLMGIVKFEPAPPDGAFAVIMAAAAATGRFKVNRAPASVTALVAALLTLNVLSMMEALHISVALRFFFITGYLAVFSLWLVGWLDSPSRARTIVVTWLWIGTISAVLGIAAVLLPLPGRALLLGDLADNGVGRAEAFFKDPNVFGPFLIPIAVILLEERLTPRLLRLRKRTSAVLFFTLALGVLMSYSRAAWLNFLLAIVVMLVALSLRRAGARKATRLLASLLAVGALVAVILAVTGSISFLQSRAHLQSYDTQRFGAQHLGLELPWTHPVGVGPGQFQFYSPVETHSTYIRVLSEQGFLGLATWLGLVIATSLLAMRNVVRGRDTFGIGSAALLGAWAGLVLNSAVVDTLHWRHLWVVAALIWAGAARERFGARDFDELGTTARPPARPVAHLVR